MNTVLHKRAAGLYYSRDEAEAAVRALKEAGYNMNRVSVIARDSDRLDGHETTKTVGNKADEGATAGAVTGGALGGITGLLVGLGALAIPGIGPILLAGAEATAIATTLAGVGVGAVAGGLVGALIGLGIPEEKAKIYSDRVGRGSFLVMVTGTPTEIERVRTIMHRHGVEEFDIYDIAPPTPSTVITAARTDATVAHSKARTDVDRQIPAETENIELYEERLVVDKERTKTGEVAIGKRVITETAEVSVPVNKEQIIIERRDAVDPTVNPDEANFRDGAVTQVDIYEESADIDKQAFVREEVNIRKEVKRDTIEATERIRREELEVRADGKVIES
ncbi:MAG: DUF2382 domain-containing protein [Pleurocapsa sp.]